MLKVTIPDTLMDLNTFINKQRTNRYVGNYVKQQETLKVSRVFSQHLDKFEDLKLPIRLDITWVMENRRKDKDNIAFAMKFILDGMIKAGIIENDGWNEISGFTHHFKVDKENPRVEVKIKEVKR